jgi:hypothetical protein
MGGDPKYHHPLFLDATTTAMWVALIRPQQVLGKHSSIIFSVRMALALLPVVRHQLCQAVSLIQSLPQVVQVLLCHLDGMSADQILLSHRVLWPARGCWTAAMLLTT